MRTQEQEEREAASPARRPLVIGGVSSGVGKTTVAAGIMGALARRGLSVAPFKVGPDYIDPGFHQLACGAESRNLDTWLTDEAAVRGIFKRGAAGADVSVIEGVMGLFDGRAGAGGHGSTAEAARLTGGAVVLVADCGRMARSLAPILSGFARFDSDLTLGGVILNNVGSDSHAVMLREAAREAGVAVVGVLPRQDAVRLPSRHLGLVPAGEGDNRAAMEAIADLVAANVDLDALLELAGAGDPARARQEMTAADSAPDETRLVERDQVRLAVAWDEAFCFYYVDSLEALREAGARLVFFSPLHDERLPECDGLYLGGGFPEMFADRLEENGAMRAAVAEAISAGLPAYAECGGLVYLCRGLDVGGRRRRMAGAVPLEARMTGRRQALGYVEARARGRNLLFDAGERVRGHEFHWSAVEWDRDRLAYDCFSRRQPGAQGDGFGAGRLLATYVHIHFGGNRRAAARLVQACAQAREAQRGVA